MNSESCLKTGGASARPVFYVLRCGLTKRWYVSDCAIFPSAGRFGLDTAKRFTTIGEIIGFTPPKCACGKPWDIVRVEEVSTPPKRELIRDGNRTVSRAENIRIVPVAVKVTPAVQAEPTYTVTVLE